MQSRPFLDIVLSEHTARFKLLPTKDKPYLFYFQTFNVVNFVHDFAHCGSWLCINGYSFTRQRLDKNLPWLCFYFLQN